MIFKPKKSSLFLRNGSYLLKDIIALCDGKCNPFRNFTAEEIISATNNFQKDQVTSRENSLYSGSFNNILILVHINNNRNLTQAEIIRNLAVASQLSHHKNTLKLLGVCLELDTPAAVYEDPGGLEPLFDLLFGIGNTKAVLPWSSRLRIANDIANTLVYLHTAFSTPLIYRDLKPTWILIDQFGATKLYNFALCLSLPPGKSKMKDDVPKGTFWYLSNEYACTGTVTTKCDVYSFGVVLLNLLMGCTINDLNIHENTLLSYMEERIGEEDHLRKMVDKSLLTKGGGLEQEEQLQALLKLAIKCINEKKGDQPEMIDVAKELKRIEKIQ